MNVRLFWVEEIRNLSAGGIASTDREIFRAKSAYPGAFVAYSKSTRGHEESLHVPVNVESVPEELM